MEQSVVKEQVDQASVVAAAGAVGEWALDIERSSIAFSVKKFWGLATVRGVFSEATGRVGVGEAGTIEARLEIEAASVATGNAKRDDHLRTRDFFDAANFPVMSVAVDAVELTDSNRGVATGRITILGETRPIEFDAQIAVGALGDVAEVRAELVLDRSAFGMSWSPLRIASMKVGIEVVLSYRKHEG